MGWAALDSPTLHRNYYHDRYTPNVAAPGRPAEARQAPYSLLVQRQSGTFNTLDVTIIPDAQAAGVQGKQQITFNGVLDQNRLITLELVS